VTPGRVSRFFFLLGTVKIDVFFDFRSGSDKAHFAEQNIKELRQFVDLEFAQPVAGKRYSWVAAADGYQSSDFIGIGNHGAELEDSKNFATTTDTLLAIKNRARRARLKVAQYFDNIFFHLCIVTFLQHFSSACL